MLSKYEEEHNNWYRATLKQQWIPLPDMRVGYYLCDARNFTVGYWNGTNFDYIRTKFNTTFSDTEDHYDTGAPHGTVKPIRYLDEYTIQELSSCWVLGEYAFDDDYVVFKCSVDFSWMLRIMYVLEHSLYICGIKYVIGDFKVYDDTIRGRFVKV